MEVFAKYCLPTILIAVLLMIGTLISMFREKRTVNRKLDEVFRGRERLSPESFYETYFQTEGVPRYIAVRVRQVLESEFGYDLSRLSAEDDLTSNLEVFFEHDSLLDMEMLMSLEEEFEIKIEDEEAGTIKTIRDIVLMVAGKVQDLSD